jgi:hypothetical protein
VSPTSESPTSAAPTVSPQAINIFTNAPSQRSDAILYGPAAGAAAVGALVLYLLYTRRKHGNDRYLYGPVDYYTHYTVREVLESCPAIGKNHTDMSDDMLMVYCGNEMPKIVNVFNTMTKQSQEKWISTLETFLFKMGQKFVVEELSKWGNAWKALLFNFLTHARAGMDDFTVVDSKGKRVAVKKQLLTLGVMVMSKIDLDVFLAAESEGTAVLMANATRNILSFDARCIYQQKIVLLTLLFFWC